MKTAFTQLICAFVLPCAKSRFSDDATKIIHYTCIIIVIQTLLPGYGITTDGTTTFINAATCDEHYVPINPPVVFDFPVPPGYTKNGSLKWLIRNEPWKNKANTN